MTIGEWIALFVATISLAGTGVQFWKARSEKRRDEGAAAESISQAAAALIDPLKVRIEELERKTTEQETEIEALRKQTKEQQQEITELRAGVMLLTTQIVALGQQPIYVPTRKEEKK